MSVDTKTNFWCFFKHELHIYCAIKRNNEGVYSSIQTTFFIAFCWKAKIALSIEFIFILTGLNVIEKQIQQNYIC